MSGSGDTLCVDTKYVLEETDMSGSRHTVSTTEWVNISVSSRTYLVSTQRVSPEPDTLVKGISLFVVFPLLLLVLGFYGGVKSSRFFYPGERETERSPAPAEQLRATYSPSANIYTCF